MARRRSSEFTEKEFYLDEFHERTLLCAVRHDGDPRELRAIGEVAADLARAEACLVLLLAGNALSADAVREALAAPLAGITRENGPPIVTIGTGAITPVLLRRIWDALRGGPIVVGLCGDVSTAALADFASRLAERLKIYKLVIVDPLGGVRMPTLERHISFMDEAMLEELLRAGQAEADGMGERRETLQAVRDALLRGVEAVNLCTLEGLARELFTYEGSGTLCTRVDYCRVEPLGIDDFPEVEKLLERGQREGYLKARGRTETAEILLGGYGATIGVRHLAGVCALRVDPYVRHRAGEIVGLYTLTRFKGEGVGVKLIERMKREGTTRGLDYLFAATTQERVGQFFERQGFRRVGPDEVPPEKWQGYDDERRAAVALYRLDLAGC
jgi:N-acetylglutamate synthase-like GNAT family acetyltransferase